MLQTRIAREATVLFIDIKGFTAGCAQMTVAQVPPAALEVAVGRSCNRLHASTAVGDIPVAGQHSHPTISSCRYRRQPCVRR